MSKNRGYLQHVSDTSSLIGNTHFIDPNVTRRLPIIFGFKHFESDRKPFICQTKHAEGMLYVLKTLKMFSQVERNVLEINYPKCHPVPEDQIKDHNLRDLEGKAPNGKLHQLGRGRTPERIVGFFDTPNTNLFQICFFDLEHNLSGD